MIEPNFNLFLWTMLIMFGIKALAQMLLGAMQSDKDTKYGGGDIIAGVVTLIILAFVVFS